MDEEASATVRSRVPDPIRPGDLPRAGEAWSARSAETDRQVGDSAPHGKATVLQDRPLGNVIVLDVSLDAAAPCRTNETLAYRPSGFSADMPILVVMHGILRDPWTYLESWVGLAEHHGFVLVVPRFSRADWPTSREYNFGNVRSESGAVTPTSAWSFTAVDTVVDAVCETLGLKSTAFYLYGHSAGAQFVHRYVLHTGGARIARAASANAGWYMLPDRSIEYPYGVSDTTIDEATLKAALETPLVLLLGERDNDPQSANLRSTARAREQGPHRVARGLNVLEAARSAATDLGVTLQWRVMIAEEVGHSDRAMAPFGCAALLGDWRAEG